MRTVRTSILLMLFIILALMALAGRCFYLQYYQAEHFQQASILQLQRNDFYNPQRGVILDRRGVVLAASNKVQTIYADAKVIDDPVKVAAKLAPILDMNASQILDLIINSKNPRFIRLKANAPIKICEAARKIHKGINVTSTWQRDYPTGNLACHVVGFTSFDNLPLGGVELKFDKYLTGSVGKNTFLIDNRRNPIRLIEQNAPLTDGAGLILTIDATIQQFTREALYQQYTEFQAQSATAIVANPKTGEILAMVSLPDFDPQKSPSTKQEFFRNQSIVDPFEPGSILKPFTVAIALDSGAITPSTTIFCENGNYYGKSFGRINEYQNHGFGNLTAREILIKSSNIGMAKIGQKLGKQRLFDGMRRFGFGQKTGIELPGEDTGMLRDVSKWSGYSVTRIPYGYEIAVTPMQILRAFCMIANGGKAVRPFMVKAIIDNNGKIEKIKQPLPPVGYVIKPEVAKYLVTNPLVGVINDKTEGATGWRAKLDKWQVFGKTGTANIARVGAKGYHESANNASFLAGAPAEDPQIVVLIQVSKPNRKLGKGDSGGAVAAPVAAKIIEKTLTYLENQKL
jgi:cell division protein FtsI/penicillin-binding protein 2